MSNHIDSCMLGKRLSNDSPLHAKHDQMDSYSPGNHNSVDWGKGMNYLKRDLAERHNYIHHKRATIEQVNFFILVFKKILEHYYLSRARWPSG